MHIIVLGAGLVGSAIVKDLVRDDACSVTAVDISRSALDTLAAEVPVRTLHADLRQRGSITGIVGTSDLVVCAVPGFMGFATLREVIMAGKNVVDISFFPEDAFLLDDLAKQRDVTAVVDCGVAPGLCNILAGHVSTILDRAERYECYVGGLPVERRLPYEYKAVFSPADVIEEYTRPVRMVEYGHDVVRPALSEVELLDFPEVGTLEAFNTDGLRTLRRTIPMPFMKEKTLRYPGHARLMSILRDGGFFDPTPIDVNGQQVSPLAVTSRLLFEQWRRGPDDDLTVMRVVIEGAKAGKRLRYTYDLLDRYDPVSRTTAMARTTGYTCAIVARQILAGLFTRRGICPPEYIGQSAVCYDHLRREYARRSIVVAEKVTEIA